MANSVCVYTLRDLSNVICERVNVTACKTKTYVVLQYNVH